MYEINDTYDGAGFPTARVDTQRWQDPETGQINTNTTNTYYLHSAALGGAVVATLDTQGNKSAGNIYAPGMQVASETIWSGNYARMEWQHSEPITGSSVTSNFSGNELSRQELDPLYGDINESAVTAGSAQLSTARLSQFEIRLFADRDRRGAHG